MCPQCSPQHSTPAISWITTIELTDNVSIQHARNTGEFKIPNTRYKADGYCAETNTIYEFWGDFWHGNPLHHAADDINPIAKKTFGELYKKTQLKRAKIIELGYNLVEIWESDWSSMKVAAI